MARASVLATRRGDQVGQATAVSRLPAMRKMWCGPSGSGWVPIQEAVARGGAGVEGKVSREEVGQLEAGR